jgi:drug/metabolite transporter (DMT)-like permease
MIGLTFIQASVASIVVMSEIMFAGIYARIFLDERLTPLQITGAVCVISGVIWLSSRRNNQA